jgi:hypothetical protein
MGVAVPPEILCRRARFSEVLADAVSSPWNSLEPSLLRLNCDGSVPEQGTSLRIGWDAECLRILFVAEDSHPWATLNERDAPLYKEEVVEVFLDTEADGFGYFEIEVNPNNAVLDGCMRRVRNGFRKDFRWRCEGLQTAVRKVEGGWVAELALPFTSLSGVLPVSGTRWRANFTRIDRPEGKPRELSAWSPTGRDQFHIPERFGWLIFC